MTLSARRAQETPLLETVSPNENEPKDAERVDQAMAALAAGNPVTAETLLLRVIANTPAEYTNSSEDADGTLAIKFWDQQAFIQYVMWQRERGQAHGIRWIGNAYPRAYYYLGFLCVRTRQYERALEYLERGHELEPTNPKFNFQKAQALVQSGEKERALALYDAVTETGPYVSALDVAMARRGRGFVLTELGRLDEAEAAFRASLEIQPDNPAALNELQYIDHLRKGGKDLPASSVAMRAPSLKQCAMCGKTLTKGVVVSVQGVPRSVCGRCERRLTRKWWQFWR